MNIDQRQIEHLAELSRLNLSAEEKKKFNRDLNNILDYFNELNNLTINSENAKLKSVDRNNLLRTDEVKNCDEETQKNILGNVPIISGRYIKTNKVL